MSKAVVTEERPIATPIARTTEATWRQVIQLFQKFGMAEPPWELRDELVTAFEWAWYGQSLDAALEAALSHGAEAVEPEQKPVAWLCEDLIMPQNNSVTLDREFAMSRAKYGDAWKVTPLYASPVRSAQEAVKVKPLEWDWSGGYGLICRAVTPIGTYSIHDDEDSACGALRMFLHLTDEGDCTRYAIETTAYCEPEDLQAAAQADYERRVLSAIFTAPPSAKSGEVEVKALNWSSFTDREGDIEAISAVGRYAIRPSITAKRYRLFLAGWRECKLYHTIQEAKAAAQADYEQRILSALLPPGGETATPDSEHRQTFTVPHGYEPVFDDTGRATGEIRPALSEKQQ